MQFAALADFARRGQPGGPYQTERSRRDDGSRRGDDMGQCLDAVVGGRWLTPRLRELPEDAARWSVRFLAFAGPHTDAPSSRWLLPWL
jgi:hypothetical protein